MLVIVDLAIFANQPGFFASPGLAEIQAKYRLQPIENRCGS